MSELLLISLGTTPGLRVADGLLLEMLREAGADASAVRVRLGVSDVLRRGYPVNDLVEAVAARRTLRAGVLRERPRAVIVSTTTAALLAPGACRVPYAVRLDAPAALNRGGVRNAAVRALERRSLAGARLVLPLGVRGAAALPAGAAPAVVVPVPVDFGPGTADRPPLARDPNLAVAYVPDPATKGLEVLLAAWQRVVAGSGRLEVYGRDEGPARSYLARRGCGVPAGVSFGGFVADAAFRGALRRARAFVSAARWEDYGQAPLEALWEGALLVTVPAPGPYEALSHARALAPALVAADGSPEALSAALAAGLGYTETDAATYAARARERLAPYRRAAGVATLRDAVLPALLG